MKPQGKSNLAGLALMLVLGLAAGAEASRAQLPPSKGAPKVGEKAPEFTLPDSSGKPVKLSELLSAPLGDAAEQKKPAWLLLLFYRGYW